MIDFDTFTKIVAKGFQKLPKAQKIGKSVHTASMRHAPREPNLKMLTSF